MRLLSIFKQRCGDFFRSNADKFMSVKFTYIQLNIGLSNYVSVVATMSV